MTLPLRLLRESATTESVVFCHTATVFYPKEPVMRVSFPSVVKFWAVSLCLLVVSSCYVPNDFVAEIRLGRDGSYALTYQGNLTWAPLYKDVREGTISAEERKTREKAVIDDLQRDPAFKVVTPLGSGTFKVRYESMGRFSGTQTVAFVRRSSPLLLIEVKPNGTVLVRATQDPKLRDPGELEKLGLRTQGQLRLITDVPSLQQNAQKVGALEGRFASFKVYDWVINSVRSPKPFFVGRMFTPPAQGQ